MINNVKNKNFNEEVLNSDKPVLVDFWASFCRPCKMIGQIIEELSEEIKEVKFIKIQIDAEEDVSNIISEYEVKNLPTILFFKDGKVAHRVVGVIDKKTIIKYLEEII